MGAPTSTVIFYTSEDDFYQDLVHEYRVFGLNTIDAKEEAKRRVQLRLLEAINDIEEERRSNANPG